MQLKRPAKREFNRVASVEPRYTIAAARVQSRSYSCSLVHQMDFLWHCCRLTLHVGG